MSLNFFLGRCGGGKILFLGGGVVRYEYVGICKRRRSRRASNTGWQGERERGEINKRALSLLLTSVAELSLTVPITNSLAFLFTVLGEWWAEGKVISRGMCIYIPHPPRPPGKTRF